MSSNTRRIDPIAIPKESGNNITGGEDGNVILMEARLCEIVSSLRALIRSNNELEEALIECPGDKDFIDAIAENNTVIIKKQKEVKELVREMKIRGVKADVPEDIMVVAVRDRGNGERGSEGQEASGEADSDGRAAATSNEDASGIYL